MKHLDYGPFGVLLLFVCAMAACGGGVARSGQGLLIDQIGYDNSPPSQMWVTFNSTTEFQKVKEAKISQQTVYIYGVVISDPQQPLGFRLDPNTASFWPGGIPELVKPMLFVSQNVAQFDGTGVVFVVKVNQVR